MTAVLGSVSLGLALLAAMLAVVLSAASARFASRGLLTAARWTIGVHFGLLTVASAALIVALLKSDFSISYVVHYTERALPVGYKLAAFWAGQAGSLLLWAWLIASAGVVYVVRSRREEPSAESASTIAVMAIVMAFFAGLMLYAGDDGNPFIQEQVAAADGRGLNPMLQDPAMIAHPPMLFMGYAGYTIPFAITLGALIAGRSDRQWVSKLRRWSLVSWLFLTVGILLGCQWAYYELGWGGYWAWDPVENASLLPWLTGTALLHSIMPQQHRGMLKMWNALLVMVSFVLCIFGTYLTRSGVVSSVHAFGGSVVGTMFLVFLVVTSLVCAGMLLWRRKALRSEAALETLLGREGMFLTVNILLMGMMLVTLVGTIFPIFSGFFSTQDGQAAANTITVTPAFYNRVVAPMGLLLVALMALGPALVYGKDAGRLLMKHAAVPVGVAASVVIGFYVYGLREPWSLVCIGIATVAVLLVVWDFTRSILARRGQGGHLLMLVLRLVDSNHRRYGAQMAHIGVIMMVAGITASSVFSEKHTAKLHAGEEAKIGNRTLRFEKLHEEKRANYETVEAIVQLTEPSGLVRTFKPERRFFEKSERPSAEVAIESTWKEDVYVTLAGWEHGGRLVAIEVLINPMVSWIWMGGIVLTAGGILALLPMRGGHEARTVEGETKEVQTAVQGHGSNGRNRKNRRNRVAEPVAVAR